MSKTAEIDYAGLIEKLSMKADEKDNGGPFYSKSEIYRNSANALTSLIKERDELKEALKPFAEAESHQDGQPHDLTDLASEGGAACMITYGELRRARAALNGE